MQIRIKIKIIDLLEFQSGKNVCGKLEVTWMVAVSGGNISNVIYEKEEKNLSSNQILETAEAV